LPGPRASSRNKMPTCGPSAAFGADTASWNAISRAARYGAGVTACSSSSRAPLLRGASAEGFPQRTPGRARAKRASCWKDKVVKYLWSRRLACYRYSGISVKAKRCHWLESGLPLTAPDEGPLPGERRQVTDRQFSCPHFLTPGRRLNRSGRRSSSTPTTPSAWATSTARFSSPTRSAVPSRRGGPHHHRSPVIHALRIPEAIDYLKLPCLDRVAADRYEPRFLSTFAKEVKADAAGDHPVGRRSASTRHDDRRQASLGVDGELAGTLSALRRLPHPVRIVLGVRDILDEPTRTRRNVRPHAYLRDPRALLPTRYGSTGRARSSIRPRVRVPRGRRPQVGLLRLLSGQRRSRPQRARPRGGS